MGIRRTLGSPSFLACPPPSCPNQGTSVKPGVKSMGRTLAVRREGERSVPRELDGPSQLGKFQ